MSQGSGDVIDFTIKVDEAAAADAGKKAGEVFAHEFDLAQKKTSSAVTPAGQPQPQNPIDYSKQLLDAIKSLKSQGSSPQRIGNVQNALDRELEKWNKARLRTDLNKAQGFQNKIDVLRDYQKQFKPNTSSHEKIEGDIAALIARQNAALSKQEKIPKAVIPHPKNRPLKTIDANAIYEALSGKKSGGGDVVEAASKEGARKILSSSTVIAGSLIAGGAGIALAMHEMIEKFGKYNPEVRQQQSILSVEQRQSQIALGIAFQPAMVAWVKMEQSLVKIEMLLGQILTPVAKWVGGLFDKINDWLNDVLDLDDTPVTNLGMGAFVSALQGAGPNTTPLIPSSGMMPPNGSLFSGWANQRVNGLPNAAGAYDTQDSSNEKAARSDNYYAGVRDAKFKPDPKKEKDPDYLEGRKAGQKEFADPPPPKPRKKRGRTVLQNLLHGESFDDSIWDLYNDLYPYSPPKIIPIDPETRKKIIDRGKGNKTNPSTQPSESPTSSSYLPSPNKVSLVSRQPNHTLINHFHIQSADSINAAIADIRSALTSGLNSAGNETRNIGSRVVGMYQIDTM